MEAMVAVIRDNDLDDELEERLETYRLETRYHASMGTGNGEYSEDDENSDATNPEEELRGEKTDQVNFVEAATAIAEARQLRLDYERRSMTLEDCRSNLDRNCLRFQ